MYVLFSLDMTYSNHADVVPSSGTSGSVRSTTERSARAAREATDSIRQLTVLEVGATDGLSRQCLGIVCR